MKLTKPQLYSGLTLLLFGLGSATYFLLKSDYYVDFRNEAHLKKLDPELRRKVRQLIKKASSLGIQLRIISSYRNCAEQNKLYAKGRTIKGKRVTNAKCGESSHNYRLAVDLVEFKNGIPIWENPNWNAIGELGESLGLYWGGRWKSIKDYPHFQLYPNSYVSELKRSFKFLDFTNVIE